jgi:micrococcal nuclease
MERKSLPVLLSFAAIIGISGIMLAYSGFSGGTSGMISGPSRPPQLEQTIVTKVIDGDTVIVEGGESVRLLGMDSDEKGYPCFTPAKKRMEELVLGKQVYLERDLEDRDIYGRLLRYIFLVDRNICLQMVKEGLAVARFPEENAKYRQEIAAAEKYAQESHVGCKWGGNAYQEPDAPASQPAAQAASTGGAVQACDAWRYIGKEMVVEGRVVQGTKSRTSTVFLNFGDSYPDNCFTAVIFSSDSGSFPENPQSYYSGRTVRVTGLIKEYQGKPEIILEKAGQIETI